MTRKLILTTAVFAGILGVGGGLLNAKKKPEQHFQTSDRCFACHNNLFSPTGEDVSIGLSWRTSMMANAGRVLTREILIDRVWGSDYVGDTKTLDVHVKRLRAKVEPDPANPVRIVTIRGLGYKFERQKA